MNHLLIIHFNIRQITWLYLGATCSYLKEFVTSIISPSRVLQSRLCRCRWLNVDLRVVKQPRRRHEEINELSLKNNSITSFEHLAGRLVLISWSLGAPLALSLDTVPPVSPFYRRSSLTHKVEPRELCALPSVLQLNRNVPNSSRPAYRQWALKSNEEWRKTDSYSPRKRSSQGDTTKRSRLLQTFLSLSHVNADVRTPDDELASSEQKTPSVLFRRA